MHLLLVFPSQTMLTYNKAIGEALTGNTPPICWVTRLCEPAARERSLFFLKWRPIYSLGLLLTPWLHRDQTFPVFPVWILLLIIQMLQLQFGPVRSELCSTIQIIRAATWEGQLLPSAGKMKPPRSECKHEQEVNSPIRRGGFQQVLLSSLQFYFIVLLFTYLICNWCADVLQFYTTIFVISSG